MGQYEDAVAAIGKQADAEIAAQDLMIETQDKTITQLNGQIEALRKSLADCQAGYPQPPEPPTTANLIGSSIGQPIPGHANTSLDVIRAYLQPGDRPTSWKSDAKVKAAAEQCKFVCWVSGKDAPDSWLDSFFKSWAETGKKLIYTQNHEFGNDGPNNGFPSTAQISEYKRRWEFVKTTAAKYPEIIIVDIQLGSQTPAQWNQLFISGLDGVGFDRYNPGIGKPKQYVKPSEVFGPILTYAKSKNLPVYIGETGVGLVGTDVAGRVKWATDARAHLLANKVKISCWWNQADCVMDRATADAWLGN